MNGLVIIKTVIAVVYEETVAEVELHDVACPGAALHAMPPAAVLSTAP